MMIANAGVTPMIKRVPATDTSWPRFPVKPQAPLLSPVPWLSAQPLSFEPFAGEGDGDEPFVAGDAGRSPAARCDCRLVCTMLADQQRMSAPRHCCGQSTMQLRQAKPPEFAQMTSEKLRLSVELSSCLPCFAIRPI